MAEAAKTNKKLKIDLSSITTASKRSKKQMIIIWKKVKKAAGYEIYYSKSKKKTAADKKIVVNGSKKTKATIKNLKKGKYFIKIIPFAKKGGKTYQGLIKTVKAKAR